MVFHNRLILQLLSILFLLLVSVGNCVAQLPGSNDPIFNPADVGFGSGDGIDGAGGQNRVYTLAVQPDGKIIVSGWFRNYNAVALWKLARLNPDGSVDATFNPGTGPDPNSDYISAVALQPDGKIIVSGHFQQFNGFNRKGIARLNPDGSVDATFDPAGGIYSTGYYSGVRKILVQPDGKIILAGSFNGFTNGVKNIARLNADGSLDASYLSGTGFDLAAGGAALQPDGKIIVGGDFTSYNGAPCSRIVRLNSDGTLDTNFSSGSGPDSAVTTVALQPDNKIVIGGAFINYNGTLRNRVARLNSDGSLDTNFNPGTGANNAVETLTQQPDGKILVAGEFTEFDGAVRKQLVRLNSNGTVDTTLDPMDGPSGSHYNFSSNITPAILALAVLPSGKLLVGGRFTLFNGQLQKHITRLEASGTVDTTFNPASGFNGLQEPSVGTILFQPDGKLIVTGGFYTYNGVIRKQIVRLLPDGTIDPGFLSLGADTVVTQAFLQADGKIMILGRLYQSNGASTAFLGRLKANGTFDTGFAPVLFPGPPPPASTVNRILVQPDGKVLVAGNFTTVNSVPRNRIARINADGTLDTGFNPGTGVSTVSLGITDLLLQSDGKLIIVGDFNSYNGVARMNIARIHADGSLDLNFNAWANHFITSIAHAGNGQFVVAGNFYQFNGVASENVARVNPDGTRDATFNPGSGITYTSSPLVSRCFVQPDGKVLVGGLFNTFHGAPRNHITRLNIDGSVDMDFEVGTGTDKVVSQFAQQADGKILIGGSFTSYNSVGRNRLARVFTGPAVLSPITVNLAASTLCAGGTVSIPFTVSGLANGGNFYTAVLSDAAGSFDNAVSIGSVSGVTSGTITATIPANTLPGTGYRIRVMGSSPLSASPDNGADLTIYSLPAVQVTPVLAPVCVGASVILSASGADTYVWAGANGLVAQSGNPVSATPTAAGSFTYSVTGTSNQWCSQVAAITVTVLPLPAVAIQPTALTICAGQTVSLTATGAGTYIWSTNQTDSVITVSPATTTTYSLTGTNTSGCAATVSSTITVLTSVQASATAAPDSLAPGQLLTLVISNPDPSLTYTWTGPNLNQTTGDTVTANPAATGNLTYQVVASNGNGTCSDTATVTVVVDQALLIQTTNWNWAVNNGSGNGLFLPTNNPADDINKPLLSGGEEGITIAADAAGNTTTLGRFKGMATFGSVSLSSSGPEDLVLLRMDNAGDVLWAEKAGSATTEQGRGVTLDAAGSSYITGSFTGTATFGTNSLTSTGNGSTFLASYSATGSVNWAVAAGGSQATLAQALATDAQGNSTLVGSFTGSASFGSVNLPNSAISDVFVARYNAQGTVVWAKSFGGSGTDGGYSVTLDEQGNTYFSGVCEGNITFGSVTLTGGAGYHKFLCKLDAAGNVLWAKLTSTATSADQADKLAYTHSQLYAAGIFSGTATFGTTTLTSQGGTDILVTDYLPNGDLLWAKRAGGTGPDVLNGIATDAQGLCYLTGSYSGSAGFGSHRLSSIGSSDVFVASFDMGGNALFARKAGGIGADAGNALAVDAQGNSYTTGYFSGRAFFGSQELTSLGQQDMFVARLGHLQAVGTEETTTRSTLAVFPNPFSNSFTIAMHSAAQGQVQVLLFDALGRQVYTAHYSVNLGTTQLQVNPQRNLPQGMYLLQIRQGNSLQTTRLIKE